MMDVDGLVDAICKKWRIGHYDYFQGARAWCSDRAELKKLIENELGKSEEGEVDRDAWIGWGE